MAMMTGQGIVLYLGVTPLQLESLRRGYEITPDQHSRRFGLRSGPHGAIERAHYFMNWSPEGNLGICSIEEMKAVKVFISGLGYLRNVGMVPSAEVNLTQRVESCTGWKRLIWYLFAIGKFEEGIELKWFDQ